MGIVRVPEIGKYYVRGPSIYIVVHVDANTFSYSFVNHEYFSSSDVFTWSLKTFREYEVTNLLAALL
jgi:hypothetical protein